MTKSEMMAPSTGGASTDHRPSQDEIAVRAHEIFLERGAIPGNDLDDWLQAEEQLVKKRIDIVPAKILATR